MNGGVPILVLQFYTSFIHNVHLTVTDCPPSSSGHRSDTTPVKLEATTPSRLALGARCGYGQRCWGSPVRQKKKHTGKTFKNYSFVL